jgi:hypothetical protein
LPSQPGGRGDLPAIGAPLNLTRTLRAAWGLYRGRAGPLVGLFVLAYLGVTAAQAAAFSTAEGGVDTLDILAAIASQVVLPVVVGSLAAAVTAVIMRDAMLGDRTGIRGALATLRPLAGELLASALVAAMVSLLFTVGPLALLAPVLRGTLFALLYGPPILIHVVALERTPLRHAWPRARSLLKGNWARSILYLLVVTFVIFVTAGLAAQPAGLLSLAALLVAYATVLGVLVPFLMAVAFVCYLDLREQAEAST